MTEIVGSHKASFNVQSIWLEGTLTQQCPAQDMTEISRSKKAEC